MFDVECSMFAFSGIENEHRTSNVEVNTVTSGLVGDLSPAIIPPVPPATAPHPDRTLHTLRALGKSDLPESFTLNNLTYRHEKTIKHDFFAATGFYLSPTGDRVVLKVGRTHEYAGLPLCWLGRWLCDR